VTVSRAIADPKRLRRLAAFVRPEAGARLLDVASGMMALAFARRVREAVALGWDVRRPPANVLLEPADPHHLPFPDDTFDIAACGPSFHHLPSPRSALGEMERVLRPGGRVVLDEIVASEQTVRAAATRIDWSVCATAPTRTTCV